MTKEKIEIKLLTEKDADAQTAQAVWAIAESAYADHSPWTVEQFRQSLASDRALFLTAQRTAGELVGLLIASKTLIEADIYLVAVVKEHQQKGIAQQLFKKLIEQAQERKLEKIFLEVRASNNPAYQLYRKLGFQEIGRRKNYYSQPTEDAIMMALDLPESN